MKIIQYLVMLTVATQFMILKTVLAQTQITPNLFNGNDIERIQAAVDSANATTHKIIIPQGNSNGTNVWKIDSAILIPEDMTVILDNCIIQLSDSSRDNMFRSKNVGIGITNLTWIKNINIIGIGDVILKGADNPRATGDGHRILSLDPDKEKDWRVSYGSDAGKKGRKQTGDWRNIMILMAYVDGFNLRNVTIENSHAWAISFERTKNADLSNIRFNLSEKQIINGKEVAVHNRDGIDLRQGCKNFRINNISGNTEDDFIALTSLGVRDSSRPIGDLNSTMITPAGWFGPMDDIEQITITNLTCQSNTRAVALRAVDSASISDIFINGVMAKTRYNSILVGGQGYGKPSLPGKINNIYAMNLIGDGQSLILVEAAVANCLFMNGLYTGDGKDIVHFNIEKEKTSNIKEVNLLKR